jgi:hypothetical protein
MPITKTSGILTGEFRLFGGQCLKIKPRYKKICDFTGYGGFAILIGYKNTIITVAYNQNLV